MDEDEPARRTDPSTRAHHDASSTHPGAASPVRLDALVFGRVQGVGYRYFVLAAAEALGLSGWVANLPGGHVRCIAEGPRRDLERLLAELERGPGAARVTGVEARWLAATGHFERFSIRSGGHSGD
jgi:acylphosphatase